MDKFLRRRNLGDEVQGGDTPVDYIYSDTLSALIIPQNVRATDNQTIYMRGKVTGSNANSFFLGGSSCQTNVGLQGLTVGVAYNNATFVESASVSIGDIIEITNSGKTLICKVNGVQSWTSTIPNDSGDNYYAFSRQNDFGVFSKYNYTSNKFESVLSDSFAMSNLSYAVGGSYVFDLVPMLDQNGISYMYDKVSGVKYYSEMLSPFSYILDGVKHPVYKSMADIQDGWITSAIQNLPSGYTSVPYIVCTNGARIDTGILSSSKIMPRFKLYISNDTGDAIVGDLSTNDSNDYRFFTYAGRYIYFDIGNSRIQQGQRNNGDNDIILGNMFVYDVANTTMLASGNNGKVVYNWQGSSNVRIFRNTNNNNSKIYYFLITDLKNNPLRLMVPCLNNSTNTYGLYDTITESFFESENSGTFTA